MVLFLFIPVSIAIEWDAYMSVALFPVLHHSYCHMNNVLLVLQATIALEDWVYS